MLCFGDSVWIAPHDTTLVITDSIPFYIQTDTTSTNEMFVDLKEEADKSELTKTLFNLAFKKGQKSQDPLYKLQKSEYQFLKYKDKIIRNIYIENIPIFQEEADTSIKIVQWARRIADKMHVDTRIRVIKNMLLFKEGDRIDPALLAENERIIYELPYINEIFFQVYVCANNPNYVDVLVLTKDKFPLGGNPGASSFHSYSLELYDLNIVGLGHKASITVAYDRDREEEFYIEDALYKIYHIGNTYITGEMFYDHPEHEERYGFVLNRNFIPPKINVAGGIGLEKVNTYYLNTPDDSTLMEHPLEYLKGDFCVGVAERLKLLGRTKADYIVELIRVTHYDYYKYPLIGSLFDDRSEILFSFNHQRSKYYKSNLIYDFGDVEYIPYGHLIEFIAGIENPELYASRYYTGFQISKGNFIFNRALYYYMQLGIGSYFNKMIWKEFDEGVFAVNAHLFSRHYRIGDYGLRNFIEIDYMKGLNQPDYLTIDLHNLENVRGFDDTEARGQQRLVINFESVTYTPWDLIGFHFALFGFYDIGFIGSAHSNILTDKHYMCFGAGVRMRNDDLVFKTVQVKLTYFPDLDGKSKISLSLSGKPDLNLPGFGVSCPEVIQFK